jgi:hypothetical protein
MKLIAVIGFLLLNLSNTFADDTVKVRVGTQSYHCELNPELNCNAANEVQQKVISLKKNGSSIEVEDKARGLSASTAVSLNGANVVYDITICSAQSCTISTVTSDSTGNINQVLSGQYNITQKSFDILGFFITTNTGISDFKEKILHSKFLVH